MYYVVLGFMFMPDDTDWSLEDWMVSVDLALKFGLCGERICRWGPVVLIAMPMIVPMIYLLVVVKERLLVVCGSVLFLCVAGCLLVFPLNEMFIGIGGALSFIMFVFVPWLLQACWMMVILLSPLQQLVRRLAFVVFGVLTLVVLSEISKLNLHQYLKPAKVSEISSPAKADIS